MHLTRLAHALAASALSLAAAAGHAGVAWDETVSGDLSGNGLAPTALHFVEGANRVSGWVGSGDVDYFSFEVPAGLWLSSLVMAPGTTVSGGASFIALQAGPQLTYPAGGIAALLGYSHYDPSQVGSDLLVGQLLPVGSPGLAAGTYSVWLNETGGTAEYSFDFVIGSPVPEPGSLVLLAAGGLACLVRQHRCVGRISRSGRVRSGAALAGLAPLKD